MIPERIKRQRIIEVAAKYPDHRLFVETGTMDGRTVQAVLPHFDWAISIELDHHKYMDSLSRLIRERKVTLIQGDSDPVMEQLVQWVKEPAIFWLDAHFNGNVMGQQVCPTPQEITHILCHRSEGNVILVDDAHMFDTDPDYPSIQDIKDLVVRMGLGNYQVDVHLDMIQIFPVIK